MESITKKNLMEYVQGVFVDTNTDPELSEKFNLLDIEISMATHWNEIIGEKVLIAKNNHSWEFLDTYTKTYLNVPMILDVVRFKYYSELPAQIMDIPNNEGLRMVAPMRKSEGKMRRLRSDSDEMVEILSTMDETKPLIFRTGTSLWGNTDVAKVMPGVRYIPEGVKVYYEFNNSDSPDIFNVGMKLVVSFIEYHMEDIIPTPFIKFDERGNPEGDLLKRTITEFAKKYPLAGTKQNLGNPEPIQQGK